FTTVGDDREEARRVGLRGMRFFMEASRYFFAGKGAFPDPDSWRDEDMMDELRTMFAASSGGSFSKLVGDQAAAAQGAQGVGLGQGMAAGQDPDDVLNSRLSAMGTPSDTIDFV